MYSPQLKQPVAVSKSGTGMYSPNVNYSPAKTTPQYSPAPKVLGTKTPTGNTVQSPQNTQQNSNDLVNQNVNEGNDSIERDFQDALTQADTAESGLRSQASQATNEINTQGQQTQNALVAQQGTAEAGIQGQEQTAQTQANAGLRGARDLFRQTQQGNIAQLSALGLSSSSVMEGLAEKLGVETARRIGGINGSLSEVMQNLSKERARVNDYAKVKTTELQQNLQNQIASIQSQLMQGVKQISDSKQLAATAKANARADMMTQARNQIYQYQNAAQQFSQQLQQWSTAKSTALTDAAKGFTINPTDTTGLQNAITNVQNIKASGGGSLQPNIDIGPQTGYLRVTPQYAAPKSGSTYEDLLMQIQSGK